MFTEAFFEFSALCRSVWGRKFLGFLVAVLAVCDLVDDAVLKGESWSGCLDNLYDLRLCWSGDSQVVTQMCLQLFRQERVRSHDDWPNVLLALARAPLLDSNHCPVEAQQHTPGIVEPFERFNDVIELVLQVLRKCPANPECSFEGRDRSRLLISLSRCERIGSECSHLCTWVCARLQTWACGSSHV